MVRVGYPEKLAFALPSELSAGVELVPLADQMEGTVELDVLIGDPYSSRTVAKWPHLRGVKLLLSLLAGTEWAPPLVGPQVTISSARGAHSIATAEWTLTAILTMLKYIPRYVEIQKSGVWKRRFELVEHYAALTGDARALPPPVLQEELHGKRVLLLGHGSIGREIEKLLMPFEVELTRVARTAREAPRVHGIEELEALLPEAEIVILILPLTEETRHLIDARRLALMRQGTLIVNAARGAIVETDALVKELLAGRLRAALDVTEPEPLPEGHALWHAPNVFITEHIAGSTPQFARRAMRVAFEELGRYVKGEPLMNVVREGGE